MRQGRYRKNFLKPEQLASYAAQFAPLIDQQRQAYLVGKSDAAEFVAAYVFLGLHCIRPKSWNGSRRELDPLHKNLSFYLSHFAQFSMRGLPAAVNQSLLSWQQKIYDLKLFFVIPTTETLLKMQSQGIRCVTCLCQPEDLKNYVLEERDSLSFTVHDLIHADHFLRDPIQRQTQVGFSRWLLELWANPELQTQLRFNEKLQKDFEYACADMNSHGAHLLKYLKAIFCKAKQVELFFALSDSPDLSRGFIDAIRKLNTPQESSSDLALLQTALFERGQAPASQAEHFLEQTHSF